ncbi:MAG: methyltransferase type 11 [Parcubacteria group bacterium Licking1014_1]|nr:MAG: methyltransferase type 11 [Parcubacteria group bacterium Licking1014_1]
MIEKNIYDNIDPEVYEKRRDKNQIEKYQYEHWQPLISAVIAKYSKGSIVLDLGCGPGNHSFEMAKYAKQVFAIDSSKRMLDYAKVKYPGIHFIYADAVDTHLENSCIDVIFSFGLFEYANKEKLMKEISRVLKPGGISVILAPNKYSFPRFLFVILYAIIGKKRICNEPSFGQMIKMFHTFGFEIVDYKMDDGLFFLPYKLDTLFGRKTWLFTENFFKNFRRNPFSMNMFFIIRKKYA